MSMKLKDGMLLFHGSYAEVEAVDFGKCLKEGWMLKFLLRIL